MLIFFVAFQTIIHKAKFQHVLGLCIPQITGKSSFIWCDAQRSWDLPKISQMSLPRTIDDSLSKGIFILPKEANEEIWKSISKAGLSTENSRWHGGIPVDFSTYQRIAEGKWLNDDAINAYIALMRQRNHTFIGQTYLFSTIFRDKDAKVLKSRVLFDIFLQNFGTYWKTSYHTEGTPAA
jgi:hypothetical protein